MVVQQEVECPTVSLVPLAARPASPERVPHPLLLAVEQQGLQLLAQVPVWLLGTLPNEAAMDWDNVRLLNFENCWSNHPLRFRLLVVLRWQGPGLVLLPEVL